MPKQPGAKLDPPETTEFTRRQALLRAGILGSATLTLPALLAACGGTSGGSSAAMSGAGGKVTDANINHVTWGISSASSPRSLDVARDWTPPPLIASSLALEPLLTSNEKLVLTPLLASSYSQPDLLHYVLELRPGIHFWDGSPVTVEDAVYSIMRHKDPNLGSQIGFLFEAIGTVEAQGNSRILIKMAEPNPALPQILTLAPVISKKFAEAQGSNLGSPGRNVTIMGTGPYEVTGFTTEAGVQVRRNPKYWGDKPAVASADLKYFSEPETMLLAARSGEIDGAFNFPLSDASTWGRVPGVETEFLKADGLNSAFLSLDFETDPWSDLHVRRALAHCCDTTGYAKAFLGGQANPAEAIVPAAMWTAVADKSEQEALYKKIPQYAYSIQNAKKELAQSAYPQGFSAAIPYPNSYPELGRALVSLSQAMGEIGVNLEVKSVTETAWITALVEHKNLGLQVIPNLPDYNDPVDYMLNYLPSANAVENAFNTANFKNPKVDGLLRKQANTTSKKDRTKFLGEILTIVGEELPYVPLWWSGPTLAIADEYAFTGFNALYYYQAWLKYVGVRS